MNQSKLDVMKQDMTRVNIDILGISKLKWMGMSEFNLDDHYIYYYGQESLRWNGVVLIVKERVRNAVLGYNLNNDRMFLTCFQDKPFNITIIQDYTTTTNAMEPDFKWIYEDLWELSELTPKSNLLFIMGNWNANVRSQEIPGVTGKFGLGGWNRAGRRLTIFPKEHTGHGEHPPSTTE